MGFSGKWAGDAAGSSGGAETSIQCPSANESGVVKMKMRGIAPK
jgi:hypothetical protein